ncbi:hypothetical protein C2E23DRAFT_197799 [Lenzites betulinus]|nr:hypothetical protein C2E23DRAFT_197799 [Lenzites betulinus]
MSDNCRPGTAQRWLLLLLLPRVTPRAFVSCAMLTLRALMRHGTAQRTAFDGREPWGISTVCRFALHEGNLRKPDERARTAPRRRGFCNGKVSLHGQGGQGASSQCETGLSHTARRTDPLSSFREDRTSLTPPGMGRFRDRTTVEDAIGRWRCSILPCSAQGRSLCSRDFWRHTVSSVKMPGVSVLLASSVRTDEDITDRSGVWLLVRSQEGPDGAML